MMASNTNGKVAELLKVLKEMVGKSVQVGTISSSLKSIFSW